ncbi:MAG: hypothetical protein AAB675_04630 [Patescibacteria group bacterium]
MTEQNNHSPEYERMSPRELNVELLNLYHQRPSRGVYLGGHQIDSNPEIAQSVNLPVADKEELLGRLVSLLGYADISDEYKKLIIEEYSLQYDYGEFVNLDDLDKAPDYLGTEAEYHNPVFFSVLNPKYQETGGVFGPQASEIEEENLKLIQRILSEKFAKTDFILKLMLESNERAEDSYGVSSIISQRKEEIREKRENLAEDIAEEGHRFPGEIPLAVFQAWRQAFIHKNGAQSLDFYENPQAKKSERPILVSSVSYSGQGARTEMTSQVPKRFQYPLVSPVQNDWRMVEDPLGSGHYKEREMFDQSGKRLYGN